MKTKVIFRKWPNGDIIALFPEEPGNYNGLTCNSYEHFGQHGAADPNYVISITKLATSEEYKDLKEELENYGPEEEHYDLEICQRYSRQMFDKRIETLNNVK